MSRPSSHSVQAEHRFEATSAEAFDRIAYAMALLRLLKPALTVAVYPRARRMDVQRSRASGQSWAMLGIPPHATRENIARALVELSGRAEQPFLVDFLCRSFQLPG